MYLHFISSLELQWSISNGFSRNRFFPEDEEKAENQHNVTRRISKSKPNFLSREYKKNLWKNYLQLYSDKLCSLRKKWGQTYVNTFLVRADLVNIWNDIEYDDTYFCLSGMMTKGETWCTDFRPRHSFSHYSIWCDVEWWWWCMVTEILTRSNIIC